MKRVKKSKIYTRTGDSGQTSLIGGRRVSKDNQRVVAYGSLDELNAALGLAESFIKKKEETKILQQIQNDLFKIGAELANPQKLGKATGKVFTLNKSKVMYLEKIIDQYDSKLKPLSNFILPGGTSAASALHLARGVSRRAERAVVRLSRKEAVSPNVSSYLNRLSDLLFILARFINKGGKAKELLWKKD